MFLNLLQLTSYRYLAYLIIIHLQYIYPFQFNFF